MNPGRVGRVRWAGLFLVLAQINGCQSPVWDRLSTTINEVSPGALDRKTCGGADGSEFLVPDCPLPGVCFTFACKLHDECYNNCLDTRANCDAQFFTDMVSACFQGGLFAAITSPICVAVATGYYAAVRKLAEDDYVCSETAAGSVPGACCHSGSPPVCQEVNNDYTDCPSESVFIPRMACVEVASVLGGCPIPANDACADAVQACPNGLPDPLLGKCCQPDECSFLSPDICFLSAQDCGGSDPCVPHDADVYRCSVVSDTRLASTDGPPSMEFDPITGYDPLQGDVWFRYVAPCEGTLTIENCETSFYDSVIELFGTNQPDAGCHCVPDPSESLAIDDDGCGAMGSGSSIHFPCAAAGACFLIRIGGFSEDGTLSVATRGVARTQIGMLCGCDHRPPD
ncbi:MAG: hypothetical protein HY287_10440 [Planctomycetes bacterium]|nr:hypothetical protein [Planctomycetota bacterium]MBI3834735.1 hypothetical protein [Planctomycetota bacterium]